MNIATRRIEGNDASGLLNNPLFKQAFTAVGDYLEQAALSCDPDNKEKAARIVISKQLLAAVRREIVRVIEDGKVAEVQLAELERKQGLMKRVFQR